MAQARLPYLSTQEPIENLLRKLGLLEDGRPTRGAMLLFGANSQRHFLMAEIHMGRFKDGITIVDDKLLQGNLSQSFAQTRTGSILPLPKTLTPRNACGGWG